MTSLPIRRVTRRELVVDNYHGVPVADPYRWLEDDTAPEVQEWVAEQHGDFETWMDQYAIRSALKTRLTELWQFAKSGVPHRVQDAYYTWRNDGIQNQMVLYVSPNLTDVGEQVFDPNPLSEDGTIAVMTQSFSPRGNFLAYGLSQSGSDWQIIKVLDLATKQNSEDHLQYMKFSNISWLPTEDGFFYTRFPNPDSVPAEDRARFASVYLHMLGKPQSEDVLIYTDKENKNWNHRLSTAQDGKWGFISISYGTLRRNQLLYRRLDAFDAPWLPIVTDFEGGYDVIDVIDDVAYIYTQKDAPFGKIVTVTLGEEGIGAWTELIPDRGEMLERALIVHDTIVCITLHDASHRIFLYSLDGTLLREVPLPALGTIRDISGSRQDSEFFIQFCSVLFPDTILHYDFASDALVTWFEPQINFPFAEYETVQEFYASKDGTRIPLFITRKKGLIKDGSHPTVLYGYGGYNSNRTPTFSVQVLAWLEAGGVHAEPCLRGGAEYGEAWHRAGMLESKQNTFDDFIAAAEYLIAEGYTVKERFGIMGRSNGGLLTGACVTQRPDLFGAVIVWVPVLDMLRYHLFTSGRLWIGEYGCAEDPEQFPYMYAYSPLHNIHMNTVYPPTLIMTADTDDRVVPLQARKFAATMQAADGGANPILLRVEKSAGHGQGKPIGKLIDEQTDLYSFFHINLCGAK